MKKQIDYSNFAIVIIFSIIAFCVVGEVKCIYKALNCNWSPIGKAEVVYTVGALTYTGSVIGWFNIEDK